MSDIGFPLLSTIIWLPALGALLLQFLPRDRDALHRQMALIVAALTLALTAALPFLVREVPGQAATVQPEFALVDRFLWLPALGAEYFVGVDGISMWLVILTAFLAVIAIWGGWEMIAKQTRAFLSLLLLAEAAMFGVFLAQDLLLFYVFWEFTLIPMTFLIGMWGEGNAAAAARKFFLYTFAGSVFMLLAIIALYLATGSLALPMVVEKLRTGAVLLDPNVARLLFGAFFVAFAIKAPIWPFHTWLPDAYTAAPTPVLVLLAGVMGKMGLYGFIRFNLAIFPEASRWAAPAVGILAVIGIIYGAMIAAAQSDTKRLVAYSSVSHVGFIALGVFALNAVGVSGAVLQMVNHGITTAGLFFVVAYLESRRGTRELDAFGGLWSVTPVLAGLALVIALASAGLPGLNGFVGEYTIMQGAFASPDLGWGTVSFAVIGVILAAVYLLRMFRGTFMGEVSSANASLADVRGRELLTLIVLIVPMVAIGLFPNALFSGMQASVADVVNGLAATVAGR